MTTKFCPRGNHWLPPAAFNKRSNSPDGLQSYCRTCNADYVADYYATRPDQVARRNQWRDANPDYQSEYFAKRYADDTAWALERVGGPDPVCDPSRGDGCGISNEAAIERDGGRLQFDHIDPATKEFNIAARLGKSSREVLQPELNKCRLLCTPCHKAKTSAEARARAAAMNVRFGLPT